MSCERATAADRGTDERMWAWLRGSLKTFGPTERRNIDTNAP